MPPFRALATAATVLTLCGCAPAEEPPPAPPAATVAAPCVETAPTPTASRPPVLAETTILWYGQDDLWVGLPDYPPVAQGGALMLKFPVVTLARGVPTAERGAPVVTAARADAAGEAPGQVGGFDRVYGTDDLSFWPASVSFPEPGCWTVTVLLGTASVQFTVSVERP
jgi:hypothetical protein